MVYTLFITNRYFGRTKHDNSTEDEDSDEKCDDQNIGDMYIVTIDVLLYVKVEVWRLNVNNVGVVHGGY